MQQNDIVNDDRRATFARRGLRGATLIRVLLVIFVILASLALVGSFTMRFLIERSVNLEQVQDEASAALGRRIEATSIEVSAIYGLVLSDVKVFDTPDTSPAPLLMEAKRIRIRPSWWRLLRGDFQAVSIRLLEGVIYAERRQDNWNVARLWTEIASRPSTDGITPAVDARDLMVRVTDTGSLWHTWMIAVDRFTYHPSDDRTEVEISSWNGAPTLLEATLAPTEHRLELNCENLPRPLSRLINRNLDYDGIHGSFTLNWTHPSDPARWADEVRIEGEASGAMLSIPTVGQTSCRLQNIRTRRISSVYRIPTDEWTLDVEDLKVGNVNAGLLRISASLEGRSTVVTRCKLDWEGPAERVLALTPRALAAEITRYNPKGSSAGTIFLSSRGRGAPELTSLSLSARGLSVTVPDATGQDLVAPGTVLSNLRGRIEYDGRRLTVDSMAANWEGDEFILTGRSELGSDTETDYLFTLLSDGFDATRIARYLPDGVGLDGRIGANLAIDRRGVEGTIRYVNARVTLPDLGTWQVIGGTTRFGRGERVALENVLMRAGEGTIEVGGEIVHAATRRVGLHLVLNNAGVAALAPLLESRLEELGLALQGGSVDGPVEINGASAAPDVKGSLALSGVSARYSGLDLGAVEGPIRFDSVSLSTPGLSGRSGTGSFRVAGMRSPRESKWNISLEEVDAGLATPFLPTRLEKIRLSGPISARLVVSGRGDAVAMTGSIQLRSVSFTGPADQQITGLQGAIELSGDRIVLQQVAGQYLGGAIRLSGVIPNAETASYALAIHADRMRIEHATEYAPEGFEGSGSVENVNLLIAGPPAAPEISGSARFERVTVRTPFLVAPVADLRGDAAFGPDTFHARGIEFKAGQSQVRVSGLIEHFKNPILRSLTLRSENARIEDLLNLIPPEARPLPRGASIAGGLSIDSVVIDGPMDRARWTGRVVLKDGRGELPGLRKGATGISGPVEFRGDRVVAPSLVGRIGESDVRFEGELKLQYPYDMEMKVAIRDADIGELYSAIPSTTASEKLAFAGRGTIASTVRLTAGKLRIDGTIADGATRGFGLSFEEVGGSYRYDGATGMLTMSDMTGQWAGGRTSGGFLQVDLDEAPPAFTMKGSVAGAQLAQILAAGGFNPTGYAGLVEGTVSVSGRFGEPASVDGEGELTVRKAQFQRLKMLDSISRSLRLDLFSRSTYETAKATFRIEDGVVRSAPPNHIRFQGPNFTLELRGYCNPDGTCAYNFNCGMPAGVVGSVLNNLQIGRLFALSGEGQVIRSSGIIRGSLENPIVEVDLGLLNSF